MKKYIIGFLIFIVVLVIIGMASGNGSYEEDSYEEPASISALASIPEETMIEEEVTPAEETAPVVVDLAAIEIPVLETSRSEQLLSRVGYVTSYNKDTRCPNWVAWHLTKDHTDGSVTRNGVPYYDEEGKAIGIGYVTPETCRGPYFFDREAEKPSPSVKDYPNNRYGMSHGHICPAGDNKWSKAAMNQSFLMTNMCPQDNDLNGGDWRGLVERCRSWARRFGDIYIVAGPLFQESANRTIGENKVHVPDSFFKVILCLTGSPKAIGFIFPNTGEHHELRDYVYSVDEVEGKAGIDFFPNLPDEVEEEVERESNLNQW